MTKDSFELHVQKVLKTGPTVSEHAPGNTGEDKEKNNCLVEISCNSADTSGKPYFFIYIILYFSGKSGTWQGHFLQIVPNFSHKSK